MRLVKPARFARSSILAAILVGRLGGGPAPTVSISVDTLGNSTFTGPNGAFALGVSTGSDPGPGGLASVLAYTLQNPPSLVHGDVQLTGPSGVVELIRFNAAGTGTSGYPASLLFYGSPNDGAGHVVSTPTPPSKLYPNVVSVPVGTVYTPTPGQPGFVAFLTTHYTFLAPTCSYTLTPPGASISGDGGSGSFTATPSLAGCPIAPVSSSNFLTFSVAGSTVNYNVAPNPLLQARTGSISVGAQSFTVSQSGAAVIFQPSSVVFTSNPLAPPPAQSVSVSGVAAPFTVSVNAPWVTVTSSSTQLPATLIITVNPAGLSPGSYSATITLNVSGTQVFLFVSYIVQALPSLVSTPAQLTFNYSTGGALPASQQLSLYSTSPVAFQASATGFLSVTPTSGTTTQTLTVSVNPANLMAGKNSASITITASGVTNSPFVIPVTLNVTSTGPQFTSVGVVNAATVQTGPIAPGSLFTVFGTNLANSQLLSSGPGFQTTLNGVSMTIGGVAAPLQFVSPTQINAQAPFETPLGQQTLAVTANGITAMAQVTVVPAAPGIFQVNNRGAILNQDFSLNTPANPALVGSVVQVFFTGQGLVSPPVPTGAPPPLTTISVTNATTTATIGGQPAQVIFSGLAPGLVGLGQADVVTPSLPTNDYPLVLTVNGVASNSGTVAVKTP